MSDNKDVSVIVKALDQTAAGLKTAHAGVSNFASSAKSLIATAFAGLTIIEFFKTAMEHSIDAEKSYVQLSNTLANVGVSYEKNRGEIDETIKSLQKVANVRTDDAIKGFNTLVQRSGDYKGSLKEMVLVADLAKAKHLEFNDAAELVGRVMGGNTRVLKQFGIVTKDAHEGLALLAERLHGAAAADMATFGGQVEAVKIKFFDLAESFGDIITGSSQVGGGLSSVGEAIAQLTKSLNENRSTSGFWASAIVTGAKEGASAVWDLIKIMYYGTSGLLHLLDAVANVKNPAQVGMALAAMEADSKLAKAAADHLDGAGDRIIVAAANAEHAGAAIKEASDARLKANADRKATEDQKKLDGAAAAQQKALAAEEVARNAALDKQVAMYGKAAQLREFQDRAYREQAIAGLNLMESLALRELAGLDNTNASLARRLVLEDRLAKIRDEKKKAGVVTVNPIAALESAPGVDPVKAEIAADQHGATVDTTKTIQGIGQSAKKGTLVDESLVPHAGFMDTLNKGWEEHRQKVLEGQEAYRGFGEELATIAAGPLAQFAENTMVAMGAMIVGSKSAGVAFKAAMLGALSSVAKIEGDWMVGKAIAASAKAWGGNPFGTIEGTQWMLGAAAMYAVSGAAGAMASGGGGGGGGGGGAGATAQNSSNTLASDKGSMTVVLNGTRMVIDSSDPRSQDDFMAMLKKLAGNRQIDFVVNPNG